MKIRSVIIILFSFLLFTGCNKSVGKQIPISELANDSGKFNSFLKNLMDKGIMLGHQDAVAFGYMWYGENNRSDVKSICGDLPAVIGWDLRRIETGSLINSDSVSFKDITEHIINMNLQGGISVIKWCSDSPVKPSTYFIGKPDEMISSILPNGVNHKEYLQGLDRLANFFLSLKDENGKFIPVVFNLFQNYNNSSSWWRSKYCTPQEYTQLWTTTVNYLRHEKNIHHILYAYSVYAPLSMDVLNKTYPGNNYVDIIGTDIFLEFEKDIDGNTYKRNLNTSLNLITNFSKKHNKIPAITNTGLVGIKISNYFTNLVYPVISKYKLSYILFEKNAWNIEEYYFIPIEGHPASEDFVRFVNYPNILTCNKL